MSYDVSMVYSDNPYVDTLVYYTKLLGLDTVLKMSDQAAACETAETKLNADLYISCMDGTAIFAVFDSFSSDVLMSAGLTGTTLYSSMIDKNNIPNDYRDAVVEAAKLETIELYEELNDYYRMLYGLPPVGYEDVYITDWTPPDDLIIDLSIPIHEMSEDTITLISSYDILDEMYEEDTTNRGYLKYLLKKISPYSARKASNFGVLYIPSIDNDEIYTEYQTKLELNRLYILKTVYSSAYKYNSDYYDNFICTLIIFSTMVDIIARVQEYIARQEVFDIRTVQYIFESHGVDYYPEIPLKYQLLMVKNLHTLLKYKSTTKCMVDICSLFGFDDIKIFKYYLLKYRKSDPVNGYSFTGDIEEDFEMKFVKVPIDGKLEDYIRDGSYHVDYEEVTSGDDDWTGGEDADDVKRAHLEADYNYTRTKYLSVDSIYDVATVAILQSYFFNMLYDNAKMESQINLAIPYIGTGTFNIANIFVFLSALTYQYNGIVDTIMDTQGKVLNIMGFDFQADLATIATDLYETLQMSQTQTVETVSQYDTRTTDYEEKLYIIELFNKFNIPTESIPSMTQLMSIFTNNLDIREELAIGMRNASNLTIYNAYKILYDSLMVVELTNEFFADPDTGELYKDTNGDATYTEYLRHADSTLYYKIIEIEMMSDADSKLQTIASLVDNVCYVLEQYIDTDEFSGIFYSMPAVSIDAVREYIATVINFYKSYKVHLLGINSLYVLNDPEENWVKIIDNAILERFFDKTEYVAINDHLGALDITKTTSDKMTIRDKMYFSVSTWLYENFVDRYRAIMQSKSMTATSTQNDIYVMGDFIGLIENAMYKSDIVTFADTFKAFNMTLSGQDRMEITDSVKIEEYNI